VNIYAKNSFDVLRFTELSFIKPQLTNSGKTQPPTEYMQSYISNQYSNLVAFDTTHNKIFFAALF